MTKPAALPKLPYAVPVIEISRYFTADRAAKQAVADEIDRACRSIGFLVISGHGVPPRLIEDMDRLSRAFFDLPLEIKQRSVFPDPAVYRGYSAMETSALSNTLEAAAAPPDHRELFTMNRPSFDPTDPYYASKQGRRIFCPNIYPTEVKGLQETMVAYYAAMEQLSISLMRLFALALGLEEHWFDDKINKHMSNFCLSNYPDQVEAPRPGQLRAGAHTDYGSLTILKTEDKPGGLQVQSPTGDWLDAPIVPDTFIVNIGDLMARWTNGRWVSTMHRVVNPPRDAANGSRRQSLIFFHQPNYDALVECLPSCKATARVRYPPITSGEHLAAQMRKMHDLDPALPKR